MAKSKKATPSNLKKGIVKKPLNKGLFKRGVIQEVWVTDYAKDKNGKSVAVGRHKEQRISRLVKIGNKKVMMNFPIHKDKRR